MEEMDRKRIAANVQERRRMRKLNEALEQLRSVIPRDVNNQYRRLSKIKTLRLAINYIRYLDNELNSANEAVNLREDGANFFSEFCE